MTNKEVYAILRPLTQEERLAALADARSAVASALGAAPQRESFANFSASRYPPSLNRLITTLCLLVLLGAFLPSSFRLFVAGATAFGHGVPILNAMLISGVSTVVMAETAQVVASLALAIFGASRRAKGLLFAVMAMATSLALVGNWHVAQPYDLFSSIEALFPPLLVLGMSYILKEQMLHSIEARHANEAAYQRAVDEWQRASASPEQHPDWTQFYANALRDAVRHANRLKRTVNLNELTVGQWRELVRREMQADLWFAAEAISDSPTNARQLDREAQAMPELPLPTTSLPAHHNGTHAD